jgi:hypothetical protein
MTTNGADRLKVLVQVGIFLLQVLIFVFLNDIRTSIKDHDKRLGSIEVLVPKAESSMVEHLDFRKRIGNLEKLAGEGGLWSIEQQMTHEAECRDRIAALWRAIDARPE